MEELCTCGDTANQHIDGCEQCVIPGCGCKEFEEREPCDMCGALVCKCDDNYENYKDYKENTCYTPHTQ